MSQVFPAKLNRSLRRAVLREAVRRRAQAKFLTEARKPQEGPFYWVPTPGGAWELMSWYVDDLGADNTDHTIVWRKSAAPYLAELWGVNPRDIERLTYALPRGRVSKGYSAYYINHGGDAPIEGDAFLSRICKEFNLTGLLLKNPQRIKATLDNHERMQAGEQARLWSILDQARGQLST